MWDWSENQINAHILAFILGFMLDLIVGDPHNLPHPIRLIGALISSLEKRLRGKQTIRDEKMELRGGAWMVFFVLVTTLLVSACLYVGAYALHPYVGIFVETIMTAQILATKSLRIESMRVYHCLQEKGIDAAREALSYIVGRDTKELSEEEIIRAAVETVAENTSDGVLAPMLYTAIGGPVLGFFYKAVNTMDSMVGYKNETYLYFGRAAAKLDDVMNFIPSRISAQLLIAAAYISGREFDGGEARRIHKRDHDKHASPNSAQTESVCAGALGVRLGGDSSYFGKKVKKPHIGDAAREIERTDIIRANTLMSRSAWLLALLCVCGMALLRCLL